MAQADGGDAGHGSDHGLTFFQRASLVQVGNALFGQQVGHIVAVDHDRRQWHAALAGDLDCVQGLDKGGFTAFLEGLDHLHHQLLAAFEQRLGGVAAALTHVQPGGCAMAATARVVAHVRRPAKTRQATTGDGGRVSIAINLQGRTNKQVNRVLPCQLAEHAVRAQRTVAPGEEHIRARGDVLLHAQFGAEAMHALHPTAFDGRDQGGMGVEGPVAADLALQAQRFAVGGQDQFDGGGVEADTMVERLHIVLFVDAADGHHRHQHMHRLDVAWVAGEQRLDVERLVRHHHKIDPGRWDVDSRQFADIIHQLVDLDDDDTVAEGRRLNQRRGVLGAGAGVDVARTVGHETG
ncbi:hypothetical protein D9M71_137300 [compost metagenome]